MKITEKDILGLINFMNEGKENINEIKSLSDAARPFLREVINLLLENLAEFKPIIKALTLFNVNNRSECIGKYQENGFTREEAILLSMSDVIDYRQQVGEKRITVCLLVIDGKILAAGMSICSPKDNFSKKIGRDIATGRAVKALKGASSMAKGGRYHYGPILRQGLPRIFLPRTFKGVADFNGLESSRYEQALLEKATAPVAA